MIHKATVVRRQDTIEYQYPHSVGNTVAKDAHMMQARTCVRTPPIARPPNERKEAWIVEDK